MRMHMNNNRCVEYQILSILSGNSVYLFNFLEVLIQIILSRLYFLDIILCRCKVLRKKFTLTRIKWNIQELYTHLPMKIIY